MKSVAVQASISGTLVKSQLAGCFATEVVMARAAGFVHVHRLRAGGLHGGQELMAFTAAYLPMVIRSRVGTPFRSAAPHNSQSEHDRREADRQ